MKKYSFVLCLSLLVSCTSNTIFEEPKDLIPKDTMSLLLQEMMIAASAKNVKNIHQERKIDYMPFVYNKFNIDSTRFQTSNTYYMTKVDDYVKIFEDVKKVLEEKNAVYVAEKKRLDSIRNDSLKAIKLKDPKLKVSLKNRSFNEIVKERK